MLLKGMEMLLETFEKDGESARLLREVQDDYIEGIGVSASEHTGLVHVRAWVVWCAVHVCMCVSQST